MPIHDWTRVTAGTFHDFHQTWIIEIKRALNSGRLPDGFYAMAEQITGGWGPDVLALEGPFAGDDVPGDQLSSEVNHSSGWSSLAVAERPPRTRLHAKAEVDIYAEKASAIVVRHATNHKVVAVIEVVSPGNKSSGKALSMFVKKAIEFLDSDVHLLIIDLFPPGSRDPQGMHGAIWNTYTSEPFVPVPELPLTLASYIGGGEYETYVEPTAVGSTLIDMPLFLDARHYVPVPLEMTYQSAWDAVPAVWRTAIEKGRV